MNTKVDRAPSIRKRLLALLIVPTTLVLLAGTASDYLSGIKPVRDAYDQALADAALAIAGYVRTDASGQLNVVLPPEAITVLRTDSVDSIYFRVAGPGDAFLAGDRDLPRVRSTGTNPAFRTMMFRGQPTRLATYRRVTDGGDVTTTVGETLNKRQRVRGGLLVTVLTTDVTEVALILGLVWLGVSLALKPLLELRAQVAQRSPRDLKPLAASSVPMEVRTLVDELNRLFATIAESSRSQRQFLESAAHQLRTPLAGVQAQLELLVAEEPAPAKRERLALTLGATRRLSHTTQQLLALARSEHGDLAHAEFRALDLATIAEGCVSDLVSRAVAAGLDLGAELERAPVEGIAWLLAEAVSNLIDNAITYTPFGGTITVRSGRRGDAAFVEVVDTGVGIPPDERDRATSRFFRGQRSRGTGSGLGLAIVSDVARLHDATLTIGPGVDERGTCVRLQFPAAPTAASA
jgi:two-component system, OmpR family, sensor histidine kinase TctE